MENLGENSLKILDLAIKQESDGIKFYSEAADQCKNHLGKAMFKSFVEDEKEHLHRLMNLKNAEASSFKKSIASDGKTEGVKDRLLSLLSEMRHKLDSGMESEADDIEALKVAMDIEKKGHTLYSDVAKECDDPDEKELYKFLAKEEILHYEILKNTYKFLDNVDKAHAKEEDRGYDLWVRMVNDM